MEGWDTPNFSIYANTKIFVQNGQRDKAPPTCMFGIGL